jgi:hypothetical protein
MDLKSARNISFAVERRIEENPRTRGDLSSAVEDSVHVDGPELGLPVVEVHRVQVDPSHLDEGHLPRIRILDHSSNLLLLRKHMNARGRG